MFKFKEYSTASYSNNYKKNNSFVSLSTRPNEVFEITHILNICPSCTCNVFNENTSNYPPCIASSSTDVKTVIIAKTLPLQNVCSVMESGFNLTAFLKTIDRKSIPNIVAFTGSDIKFKHVIVPSTETEFCIVNDVRFEKD